MIIQTTAQRIPSTPSVLRACAPSPARLHYCNASGYPENCCWFPTATGAQPIIAAIARQSNCYRLRHNATQPRTKACQTVSISATNWKVSSPLVKSGRYNSKSEASRGPAAAGARLASLPLDAAAARGIADVDAGRVKPLSQVFDRLEAKYCAVSSSPD